MYNTVTKQGDEMKSLKVTVQVWERLRKMAFDRQTSIGKIIEELLDANTK